MRAKAAVLGEKAADLGSKRGRYPGLGAGPEARPGPRLVRAAARPRVDWLSAAPLAAPPLSGETVTPSTAPPLLRRYWSARLSIFAPPGLPLAALKYRARHSPRGPASRPPPLAAAPARHSAGPAPALPPIHPPPAAGATCAESGSGAGPSAAVWPPLRAAAAPRSARQNRPQRAGAAGRAPRMRPPAFPPSPKPAAMGACAAPGAPWGRRAGGLCSPPPGVAAAPLCARRAALAELRWARRRPALSDGRARQ